MTAQRPLGVFPPAIEPCLAHRLAARAPVLLWALRRMAPPARLRADWADTSGPRRRRIRQDLGRGWVQLVAELPALPRSAPSLPYSSLRSLRPLHASASTTKALWRCAAMVHASCIVRLSSCLSLLSGCAIRCAAKCERSARRCAATDCAEAARTTGWWCSTWSHSCGTCPSRSSRRCRHDCAEPTAPAGVD